LRLMFASQVMPCCSGIGPVPPLLSNVRLTQSPVSLLVRLGWAFFFGGPE